MAVQRSCMGQSSASGKLTYFMKLVQRLLDSNMAPFRSLGVIKKVVAAVLKDDGFHLPSVPVATTTALNTATQLVRWMSDSDSQEELDMFALKMMTLLRSCLPQRTTTFRKAQREAMWRRYYQLHMSPSFQSLWKDFISKSVAVLFSINMLQIWHLKHF